MTMPHERTRALEQTRNFLLELIQPGGFYKKNLTPIRDMARMLLKHYPLECEIQQLAERCPELLGKDQ